MCKNEIPNFLEVIYNLGRKMSQFFAKSTSLKIARTKFSPDVKIHIIISEVFKFYYFNSAVVQFLIKRVEMFVTLWKFLSFCES